MNWWEDTVIPEGLTAHDGQCFCRFSRMLLGTWPQKSLVSLMVRACLPTGTVAQLCSSTTSWEILEQRRAEASSFRLETLTASSEGALCRHQCPQMGLGVGNSGDGNINKRTLGIRQQTTENYTAKATVSKLMATCLWKWRVTTKLFSSWVGNKGRISLFKKWHWFGPWFDKEQWNNSAEYQEIVSNQVLCLRSNESARDTVKLSALVMTFLSR